MAGIVFFVILYISLAILINKSDKSSSYSYRPSYSTWDDLKRERDELAERVEELERETEYCKFGSYDYYDNNYYDNYDYEPY